MALTNQSGVTIRQTGEELGINPDMLGRRKKELKGYGGKAFIGQKHARDEEMVALKKRIKSSQEGRDFLKEAAFFAKESK